jgi:glycosyltransferase involved in cell wall biosynthesis
MKVAHVLASVDEPTAGPSQSVPALCAALAARGVEVQLHAVAGWRAAGGGAEPVFPVHRHRQDMAALPVLGSLCLSSALDAALQDAAPGLDVIHAHGLWLMPNIYPARAARRSGRPLIMTPRGMLGPAALAFSPRKKAAFWRLLQQSAVARASCLHATSDAEYEDIRAFGLKTPVAVIRNGVDIPKAAAPQAPTAARTLLTLGRLHPKKGIDRLVRAWARVEAAHPDWTLRIVGPSELDYARTLAELVRTLNLGRVSIEPPLLGDQRTQAYRDADLFVLPTLNENFAMTVAECLAAGTPVISTKGAPWSGLETQGCGWWVDHGVEPLADCLVQAMSLPQDELTRMGARGRMWMMDAFSWDRVARDMIDVYSWLGRARERPASVRID